MKVKKQEKQAPVGLPRSSLRALERDLGVFFGEPRETMRILNQQFGVYDEDEEHAGDIRAESQYFTLSELRERTLALFKDSA